MPRSSSVLKPLSAGESLQFWARRGSCIRLVSGKAYLCESPRWLAETMLREPHLLLGGGSHVVAESGWVVVHASSACQLVLMQAALLPSPLRQIAVRLGRWLAARLLRGGRQLGQWASAHQQAKA